MTIWAALKAWILWKLETYPRPEPICKGCEARIDENARLFRLIQQYVERDTVQPTEELSKSDEGQVPIRIPRKSWSTKKALLEQNSRRDAALLKEKQKEMTQQVDIPKVPILKEIDLDKEIADVRGH